VRITLNALAESFEGFIQVVLNGNQMSTFDKLSIELFLEEQRREINIIPTMKLCFLVEDVIMEATPTKEAKPQKDEEDGTHVRVSTTKIKMMGIITPMGIIRISLGAL